MATSQVAPLTWNVPIVDPATGNPTPYFQALIQQWLAEKGVTDATASAAVQPGEVDGLVEPIVGSAVAALPWKAAVRAKTTAALAANAYANGASGVGATLTATANGALAAVDGVALAANDRLLVDQEATAAHNGIYTVTQLGDATHPYILTRAVDADEAGELVNATVKISEGSTFADQEWQCTTNAPVTVGTTALTWAAAAGGDVVSALLSTLGGDPGSDKLIFWDDSAGDFAFLATGAGITISGNTLTASGGSGGLWSLAATWVWSTNVPQVAFTDLADCHDIIIIARAFTMSAVDLLRLQLSTNNGASYYGASGDYVRVTSDGVESSSTGLQMTSATASAARTAVARIYGCDVAVPKVMTSAYGADAKMFVASASPINALRLNTVSGSNLTGGTIYVLTR